MNQAHQDYIEVRDYLKDQLNREPTSDEVLAEMANQFAYSIDEVCEYFKEGLV